MTTTSELSFLGEEFLTWLWYKSETGQSTFQLEDGSEVGATLDDFLCLAGQEEQPEQTLRNGLPTRSAEATVSLLAGKRLVRARLVLACDHEEWTLTLDGPRFAFSSVKTTRSDPDEVEEARDLGRMQSFVRVGEIVDGLYRIFLGERLQPGFVEGRLGEMREWVAGRKL